MSHRRIEKPSRVLMDLAANEPEPEAYDGYLVWYFGEPEPGEGYLTEPIFDNNGADHERSR